MNRDTRRVLLGLGLGAGLALPIASSSPQNNPSNSGLPPGTRMLSAADFGARGDGTTDDTAALQSALDTAFAPTGPGFLVIPPGTYRVTRTLRVSPAAGKSGDITRHHGIQGHGARIQSAITNGGNVLEFVCRSTIRYLLLEGLDIHGGGREGHGLYVECEERDHYLYNACLRDIVVHGCGGDGLRLIGNVFECQLFNVYARDNRRNGATFGHGARAGILSAIHVFGSVFGQNGRNGAAMINACYDVSYHGCYFLLNAREGLLAENGCTLLSNCGFENNFESAPDFARGGPGIALNSFGTLIGCTAYSVSKQTRLVQAAIASQLVMIGCSGSGDSQARRAGLARIGGSGSARATIIAPSGEIEYEKGFEGIEIAASGGHGLRLGSRWQSANLMQLGDYRFWIDRAGRLRLKKGTPQSDDDGQAVAAG